MMTSAVINPFKADCVVGRMLNKLFLRVFYRTRNCSPTGSETLYTGSQISSLHMYFYHVPVICAFDSYI